jgi:hypothetical protein
MKHCTACLRPLWEDEVDLCESCFEHMPMGRVVSPSEILSSALHAISDSDLLSSIRQGQVTILPKTWPVSSMSYYERDGLLRREARRRNLL